MRWLGRFVAASALIYASAALAVPNGEAEQAYARGDYATAFKIWFQLAEQGSVQAQLNIARMYERGEWVAQDSRAAKEWRDRAAAQGAQDAAMPGAYGAPAVANAVPGAYSQQGYAQQGYAQQGYVQQGYVQPGYVQPGYVQPGYAPPTYPPPVYYPSPSPTYGPSMRPVFMPIFRVHRHHH
jgi:hypothetical protein